MEGITVAALTSASARYVMSTSLAIVSPVAGAYNAIDMAIGFLARAALNPNNGQKLGIKILSSLIAATVTSICVGPVGAINTLALGILPSLIGFFVSDFIASDADII